MHHIYTNKNTDQEDVFIFTLIAVVLLKYFVLFPQNGASDFLQQILPGQ